MTSAAFLYLVGASWRNRLHMMASRLRRPRYAAALVAGGAYLWVFLLRPMSGDVAVPELVSQPTEMIVTVLGVLMLMGSWVFGADSSALAFTQAEVSLLFPAPLTRRSLILYKLMRAQFVVLLNALIWVYVLRRGGTALSPFLRAISLWLLFSTLNFHRLGAALVRASWREHRGAGVRRQFWSTAIFVAIAAMLFAGLFEHRRALTWSSGPGPFFTALGQILETAPASWALWPVHIVVAPTFAATTAEWLRTIGPALVMLVLHAWWVLRADTAFEDAAIVASAERARRMESMRSRRTLAASSPPRVTSTFSLSSVGHPALAVFWKNILCLRRTAQLRVFIGPLAMAVVIGAAFSDTGGGLAVVATSALLLAGMLLVFGGRLIRNDLRQDMQNLALLKALPIKPSDLMVAEVASSALPMAVVQFSLLLIAFIAAAFTDYRLISGSVRLGGLFAAPIAVLALNMALMTIQNGTAVLFPTWVRLGATVSTGVEALGQNVIATAANLASLAVGLVIPALLGYVTIRALGGLAPFPIAAGVVVASMVLAAETYAVLGMLGRAFARAEPFEVLSAR